MTIAEKVAAYEMLLEGATQTDVAKIFGVSRQYIYQLFGSITPKGKHMRCVYPGLAEWMLGNNKRAKDFEAVMSAKMPTVYAKFSGRVRITLEDIRAILRYTGLTFEQAFGEADDKMEVHDENA